jgi:DNA repair protein RadD
MVPAATIDAVVQRVCHEGALTKNAVLGSWPECRDEYALVRALVLRDMRVIAGRKGVGGFRATATVADEVAQAVRHCGAKYLSRRRICREWGLGERDYNTVRQAVQLHGDMRTGGGSGGGFRAEQPVEERRYEPEREVVIDSGIALQDWQRAAVEFLAEALQREALRILVGPLAGTIRTAIRIRENVDRPSRKAELATALVLRHGRDLLRDNEVRRALSKATNIVPPKRWHPGKAAALDFVEQLGLPIEFAGEPAPEKRPDFEYFEPRYQPVLQDFQREVKFQVLEELRRGRGRGIVTLPTGAGKTLVAVEAIREWLTKAVSAGSGGAVLWLAHTEELCEQAYQCFSQVWAGSGEICGMYLFRFWAGYTANLEQHGDALLSMLDVPCVIVSTPQRVMNLIEGESAAAEVIVDALRTQLRLIVVDEAHRAAAPSYRRILNAFERDDQQHISLIGLTATPFRNVNGFGYDTVAGAAQLREIFGRLIEPTASLEIDRQREPFVVLQNRGVLSRIEWKSIKTDITLSLNGTPSGSVPFEDIDQQLGRHADKNVRRMKILQAILPDCRNDKHSVLYFGPTVHDAEVMAYLLTECGVAASVVSGGTLQSTRRRAVADFKAGRVRVLCNCEVLTTGFDAPRVTHIVVARPTVSLVLYQQMIGRGLRGPEFGGTEVCTIMNCDDNYRGEFTLGYQAFRRIWDAMDGVGSHMARMRVPGETVAVVSATLAEEQHAPPHYGYTPQICGHDPVLPAR